MPSNVPPPPSPDDLKYIDESSLCFSRQKKGKGFTFLDDSQKPIKDTKTLDRLKHLIIPPNWINVQICSDARGHIQAVGFDAKGRKQYLYHRAWQLQQQEHKFNKMVSFGEVLPTLRETVAADMTMRGLPPQRVIATVVWLLENTFIRIGNQTYVKQNQSYGLTTLREKHVEVTSSKVEFQFKGKSGVYHTIDVENPQVAKTIKKCIELPGYEIFQYLNDEGHRQVVDSRDVNEYLRSVTGESFSAKDFRTWGGTVLAASTLYDEGGFESAAQAQKNIVTAVKEVSSHLGNKPATCRKYYIHPTVIETYETEILIPHFDTAVKSAARSRSTKAHLDPAESATWSLLKSHPLSH